MLIKIIIF